MADLIKALVGFLLLLLGLYMASFPKKYLEFRVGVARLAGMTVTTSQRTELITRVYGLFILVVAVYLLYSASVLA